jgi:hypothetical protein
MGLFDDLPDIIADVLDDPNLGFNTVTLSTAGGAPTYDPATGTVVTPAPTNDTVRAVVEDYRGLELLNGLIQAGDKKITVAAANLTATPQPGVTTADVTGDVGGAYTIQRVSETRPGSAAVIYELQCRRGGG